LQKPADQVAKFAQSPVFVFGDLVCHTAILSYHDILFQRPRKDSEKP
jgi:hypothetical protein